MNADYNVAPAVELMPGEPQGRFAAALDSAAHAVVEEWLGQLRSGWKTPAEYPSKKQFRKKYGAYTHSLTWKMHAARLGSMTEGEKIRLLTRGTDGTQVHIHMGDLEVYHAAMLDRELPTRPLSRSQRVLLAQVRRSFQPLNRHHKRRRA